MPETESREQSFEVTLITPTDEHKITVKTHEHIWDAAQRSGITLPAICHQGRCLTCAGRLLEPGQFDSSDAISYFPRDRDAGFILLCTAKPRSSLRIQTHMADAMRDHRLEHGLPAPYS